MWHLPSPHTLQPKYTELSRWEQCGNTAQCVFVCDCMPVLCKLVLVSCSPLSVSLHLSHDFPDLGSPGVSHLGHQLHSQVNCSSKWSAKQCRKKEEKNVIAMMHHCARITSAWQDQSRKLAINKPMSGMRDLLRHLKWMKRMWGKMEKQKPVIYICIKCASVNLWVTVAGFFLADLQSGKQSCRGKLTGELLHTGPID